ncbi:hypothetical protein [uncultured Croceitalea sp.]|uniref:hypothetical protein n=1 Tax=uncultured Croceitalea sp. TaxID=1798908 RepID=UPI00330583A9
MRYSLLALIIIFFSTGKVLSQLNNKSINDLGLTYGKYFELPRESVYLHLNKSTYIVGEEIWFKAYIYNRRKGLPFKETSNLYVGLYNSEGKQLKKNIYYANDGYSQGNIALDSTLSSGEYYIKTSTNWMRNFKEDDSYQEKITIYNETIPNNKLNNVNDYDMQFLPEGGNLIEGVLNTIGVKLIDNNGLGVKISRAIVKDDKGGQVAIFDTSKFGLGKFLFTPNNARIYSVKIVFKNGLEKTFILPKAQKEGINIRLEDNDEKRLVIILSTNDKTKSKIGDQSLHLLVQRDGLIRKIKVNFPKDQLYTSLLVDKNELHDYMNIITLVDYNYRPILERLFFNWKNHKQYNFNLVSKEQKFDSIDVKIQLSNENEFLKEISVSVLPKKTISYNSKHNTLTTFYLKPYVRGHIENPSYYFDSVNDKKKKEFDLLLLTQGWSKYEWKEVLAKSPEKKFEFEQGMILNASVKSKIRDGDKIFLHKPKNHEAQEISISNGEFDLANIYPVLGEKLYLSLKNKRGKLSKPDMYIKLKHNLVEDKVSRLNPHSNKVRWGNTIEQDKEQFKKNFILKKNTVVLEEVVVSGQKKNELAERNPLVPRYMKNKVTEIDVELARNYPNIGDIIRSRGYELAEELQGFDATLGSADTEPISRVKIRSRRGGSFSGSSLLLVIDGVRQDNLDVIYQFPTTQIESFYFDKLSRYEGAMSQGSETLYLFTRKGQELNLTPISKGNIGNSFIYDASIGFQPIKKFYTPKYTTYLDEAFENFGVVHWEPDLKINENGEATFRIFNTGVKDLSFFIEGMGKDGSLISTMTGDN